MKTKLLLFFAIVSFQFTGFGQGWKEVASGIVNPYNSNTIYALAKDAANNVYAGIGSGVFKWTSNGWVEIGMGTNKLNANGAINTLCIDGSGNIYAAGCFINSNNYNYVARWNGTTWSELGGGSAALNAFGCINSITLDPSGNVYAGGTFPNANGQKYVAKWNGTTWSELGGTDALSAGGIIRAITSDAAGNIYATGNFPNSSSKPYVAKFNGSFWSELGGPNGLNANSFNINSLASDGTNIYAAGQFTNASGKCYVAKFNGTSWSELGTGSAALNANNWVWSLATDAAGNVYAGGEFTNSSLKKYVAKWNGSGWSEIDAAGTKLNGNGSIRSILLDGTGNAFAAGNFSNVSGKKYVAKWQTAVNAWVELGVEGNGLLNANMPILTMCKDIYGNLYAAGVFTNSSSGRYVAKWNGTTWTDVNSVAGPLLGNGFIHSLASDQAGNIYAAGNFKNSSNKCYVAKWDGNVWTELGGVNALNANSWINKIGVDASGNVYAVGDFTNSNNEYYVAKFNGSTWSEVGTGVNALRSTKPLYTLQFDAAGNVYTGARHIVGGISGQYYVAKWDGASWSKVNQANYIYLFDDFDPIKSMVVSPSGTVYAVDEASTTPRILRSNGTKWDTLGGTTYFHNVQGLALDSSNTLYAIGGYKFGVSPWNIARWNGSAWEEVGIGSYTLQANYYPRTLITDAAGNLFTGGEFKKADNTYYVAQYNINNMPLPLVANVTSKCNTASTAKGKLLNPPVAATINILQDNNPLIYTPADSSFIYFTNGSTGLGNHQVTVKYANGIYNSQTDTTYTVAASVTPAVTISTSTPAICTGTFAGFTATAMNGGSAPGYQWKVNGTNAGTNSNSFASNLLMNNDQVSVVLTSSAACPIPASVASNTITMAVHLYPQKPVISQSGNQLISSAPTGNQWYKDGIAIPGATGNIYIATQMAYYKVRVTLNNCTGEFSDDWGFMPTALTPVTADKKLVVENPVKEFLNIQLKGGNGLFHLRLADFQGRILCEADFVSNFQLDMKRYNRGSYILHLINTRTNQQFQKIVVKQ